MQELGFKPKINKKRDGSEDSKGRRKPEDFYKEQMEFKNNVENKIAEQ